MSGSYTDPFAQASQSLGYGQSQSQMPLPQAPGGLPSDQPGMLGVSPSVWQNIAALGAGMIQGANQRTADGHLVSGTGIAGGLAGAAQGLIGNQMAQARARSEYGLQGEQMQVLHLRNTLNQATLPFEIQQARLSAAMLNPEFAAEYARRVQSAYSGIGGSDTAPPASGGYGTGDYSSSVNGMEGSGQNPRSSANGYGQLIQSQKVAFAQAHPEYFRGAASIDEPFKNPEVGKAATNWIADNNMPVLAQAGVQASGPVLAMAHRLGPVPAAAVMKAPDNMPLTEALGRALSPQLVSDYVRANPDFAKQTVGQFKQQFAGVPNYGPAQNVQYQPGQGGAQSGSAPGQGGAGGVTSPGGGSVMGSFNHSQSDKLFAQADMISRLPPAVRGMFGDPAAIRQHAQDVFNTESAGPKAAATANADVAPSLAKKGFVTGPNGLTPIPGSEADPKYIYDAARAKQLADTTTIRGPGAAAIQAPEVIGGKPTIIQSPLPRKILGPDNREWEITQNSVETGEPYVRPHGVPEWAPPGTLTAVPAGLSPGEHTAQTDAAADAFGEKSRSQYASSLGTIRAMEDMENQFNELNKSGDPGWYNSGAGADWKLEVAKVGNSMAQSFGAPPIFDPAKLAAGEDLTKQTKLAGMQALSAMFGGSKEAASIVTSTQGAVPNIENTPMGGKLVLNSIREGARWQADQHAFMTNWYHDHKGDMIGADVAFNQSRPAQMYVRRGISQVKPYEISSPDQMKRYMPGTLVYLKGTDPSKPKMIPGSVDVKLSEGVPNASP